METPTGERQALRVIERYFLTGGLKAWRVGLVEGIPQTRTVPSSTFSLPTDNGFGPTPKQEQNGINILMFCSTQVFFHLFFCAPSFAVHWDPTGLFGQSLQPVYCSLSAQLMLTCSWFSLCGLMMNAMVKLPQLQNHQEFSEDKHNDLNCWSRTEVTLILC